MESRRIMNTLFYITIITAVAFAIAFFFILHEYSILKNKHKTLENAIDKTYIKADVILQNAIIEALEYAKQNNNYFEVRGYQKLLEKMKGKRH